MKLGKLFGTLTVAALLVSCSLAVFRYFEETSARPFEPSIMELHTEILGSGANKIVFVHGLMGSSRYWKSRLRDLPLDHSVLLVDLLGFGQSPKVKSDFGLATHTEALIKAIAKAGFLTPQTTIVGHSLGAVLTLSMLASLNEPALNGITMALPVYNNEADAKASLSKVSPLHRGMIENSPWAHMSCYFRDLYRLPIFLLFTKVPLDVHLDAFSHTWQSLSLSMMNSIVKVDVPRLMKRASSQHHLLVLQNEDDEVAPFANAKSIAGLGNQAEFHSMGAGGHNAFLNDPEVFLSEIREFIAKQ